MVPPSNIAMHEPGPLPDVGSVALSKPLLAEPAAANNIVIAVPSFESRACRHSISSKISAEQDKEIYTLFHVRRFV